jgi:hypothetical protein
VPAEKLARRGEHAVSFDPQRFRPTPWVLARLHPKWPGDFVQTGAIENVCGKPSTSG